VKPRGAAPARPPGEVRLIGGRWKRSRLPVPDRPGLRPTPDRVRETLFNWLGSGLEDWRVLDAFAGSGALGLEAASRGAGPVLLLEHDAALVAGLRAQLARLQGAAECVQVQRGDALAFLAAAAPASYELVLLDPPFDAGWGPRAAALAARCVVPGGFVYLEDPAPQAPPPGLVAHRALKAGAVHAHLWRRDVAVLDGGAAQGVSAALTD
jgi:16S rRNA (guanine(966)-N(2))-methyltransferase RsmD